MIFFGVTRFGFLPLRGGGGTTISGTWAMYHIKKLTFTAVNVNRPVGQYLQQGETENLEDLPNRH